MADSSSLEVEHVPETSSRWITESITGTFNFEVANYPQLKGMAVGEFISSRGFRVGGYDWLIHFYPNGLNADCAGSASAYVQLARRGKDATAKFTLSVLERDGQTPAVSYDPGKQVFCLEKMDWGYPQFVARSKLKTLSRRRGRFTIRCVLTVFNEHPPPELVGHVEGMLGDGASADVTFGVGGREFRAHRCLLAARSPVLRAQFFGEMMEKDMPRVEVVDMDAAVFEMMLHYIYTDSMAPCSEDGGHDAAEMQHLLVAADRYGLQRLKTMCEEELCKRMDAETVMTTYRLANRHDCKQLKEACLQFMSSPEVLGIVLDNVKFSDD